MALKQDNNIVQMVQPGSKPGAPPVYSTVVNVGGAQPAHGTVFQQPMGFSMPTSLPGLEYLAQLDSVEIHQVVHLDEVLLGWERNNEYQICNSQNQQFLHAKEATDCCTRQMCGPMRPFDIMLSTIQGEQVMQLTRDLHCQYCCCPCCLQEMDILYPIGNKLATVKQTWSLWTPHFEVYDSNKTLLFKIVGDCCYFACFTDISFKIFRPDGQEAGEITKHWGGIREIFGRANDFSIKFAPGEYPLNKAILLGTTFLVDFMYFEHSK